MSPYLALFITLVLALAEIRALDFAAHRGWIESHLSRKLIHILTGPLFVLCWLLFPSPDLWYYRWLAALVPLLFTVQFALIGLGIVKDEASVKAMSRTGYRLPVTYLAVLAMLGESLPIKDVDNITITLAAVALGYLLF